MKTISIITTLLVIISSHSPIYAAASDHKQLAITRHGDTINLELLGIICDFCAQALEKVFNKQQEVKQINVDLDNKLLSVILEPGQDIKDKKLIQLVEDAGYKVKEEQNND